MPQGKFLSPPQSSKRSVKDSEERLGEMGRQTPGRICNWICRGWDLSKGRVEVEDCTGRD